MAGGWMSSHKPRHDSPRIICLCLWFILENLKKLTNLTKLSSISASRPFASFRDFSGHLFAAGWYLSVGPWPTKGSASQVLGTGNNETVKPYVILTAKVSWLFGSLTPNHYFSTLTTCHHMSPYMHHICTICYHMLPWFSRFATMPFQVNMQAREYCGSVGIKNKPIILSHHMMLLVSEVKRCLLCLCSTSETMQTYIMDTGFRWVSGWAWRLDKPKCRRVILTLLFSWRSQLESNFWGLGTFGNISRGKFGLRCPCPQDTPEDVRRKITNAACPRVLAEDPLAQVQLKIVSIVIIVAICVISRSIKYLSENKDRPKRQTCCHVCIDIKHQRLPGAQTACGCHRHCRWKRKKVREAEWVAGWWHRRVDSEQPSDRLHPCGTESLDGCLCKRDIND